MEPICERQLEISDVPFFGSFLAHHRRRAGRHRERGEKVTLVAVVGTNWVPVMWKLPGKGEVVQKMTTRPSANYQ